MRFILLLLALTIPARALAYSNETSSASVRLLGYKPSFLLMGKPDQKVQLSLKARVIDSSNFYIAYTQLMFWDLFRKSSAPFSDINFNPEFFYRFSLGNPEDKSELRWIDVGYEHESNGKDGDTSRSWDRLYVLFAAETDLNGKARLQWSAKAWLPVNRGSQNGDLERFRGLWEANVTLLDFAGPFFDRHDLTLRLYGGGGAGLAPWKGGQELTFRANKWPERKALPMLIVQFFNGYGEGLLRYNERRTGIRGGIGF